MTAGGVQLGWPTTTVVVPLTVPAAPEAVNVYVVVAVGWTWTLPESATPPMPRSMVTDVVFLVDHDSVEDWPLEIDDGVAAKLAITGSGPGGGVGDGLGVGVGVGVGPGLGPGPGGWGVGVGDGCGPAVADASTVTSTLDEVLAPRRSLTVTSRRVTPP